VLGPNQESWPTILGALGLTPSPTLAADVVIAPPGTAISDAPARLAPGTILILEGDSPLAASFGFRPTEKTVTVTSIEDLRSPQLRIIWEQPFDTPVFDLPPNARIFARDRWQSAPLLAGLRRGEGAILWLAAPPGPRGYERFPYLPQALADLGLTPPFRADNLWAFYDSSYRAHADIDYIAQRWRASGISALHVAAWHYWERDAANDEALRHLIQACHRNAIQVYAWLELPHVSEKFWADHPEWREKTAVLQDAQLDWRKLMNLANPDASAAVSAGVRDLLTTFDWDGVNLAELYFESLEGHDNPARLTPMNSDVRAEFQRASGFDPHDLFDPASPRRLSENTAGLRQFLDFRATLAARLQTHWISEIEDIRQSKPHLDLVLTHVDDRFDTTMRDKIGADVTRVLPLLSAHDFTFLIEDPATTWNLGPQRYAQIAARYAPLTPRQDKLAIDINVVERYQDVYPTKQQTGSELFQLVHQAAQSFPRVALYFENSIATVDNPLLPAAASTVDHIERAGAKLTINSRRGVSIQWSGPAQVDGKLWPLASDTVILLPPGAHAIEAAARPAPIRITHFTGDLKSASATATRVEFSYQSSARALATLDHHPAKLEIDGAEAAPQFEGDTLILPKGQHVVTLAP
jgi:hypothetical protein